jgi:SAM-dependent methyltransferase
MDILNMTDLYEYTRNLFLEDGIWRSSDALNISYPDDGNSLYMEIEERSFWFNARNKAIFEVIIKYSNTGAIFDIGGGNGYVSKYLCDLGFEAVLVEPGITGCRNALKRGLRKILNIRFDDQYFISGTIPNICIFDILEHLDDQSEFLNNIWNVLCPGGKIFVTVPAFMSLWSKEDSYAGHFRRYRIKELGKIFSRSGFRILYASYFFSFLIIPVFLFRTLPSKLGLYRINPKKTKMHHNSGSIINILFRLFFELELKKIKQGKRIITGNSIILVAEKI